MSGGFARAVRRVGRSLAGGAGSGEVQAGERRVVGGPGTGYPSSLLSHILLAIGIALTATLKNASEVGGLFGSQASAVRCCGRTRCAASHNGRSLFPSE